VTARIAGTMMLTLLIVAPRGTGANQLDACTVLSVDEIRSALGRTELAVGKASRASGGYSDCRFAGSGSGDVRVTLSPSSGGAKADFDLKPQIYADEGKKFEKVAGIGDGAYYFADTMELRVGERVVSIWVNRTAKTEAPATVKTALTNLARRAAERLRATR